LSCKKDKNSFPIEPVLEYKSFEAYSKYEAFMVLKFTDGDGDIGLKTSDTTGIYDKSRSHIITIYTLKLFIKEMMAYLRIQLSMTL
jgi:hypothetical protein